MFSATLLLKHLLNIRQMIAYSSVDFRGKFPHCNCAIRPWLQWSHTNLHQQKIGPTMERVENVTDKYVASQLWSAATSMFKLPSVGTGLFFSEVQSLHVLLWKLLTYLYCPIALVWRGLSLVSDKKPVTPNSPTFLLLWQKINIFKVDV